MDEVRKRVLAIVAGILVAWSRPPNRRGLPERVPRVAPEELGLCIQSPDGTEGVLAVWAVEARGDKGQVKRMIVTLGVAPTPRAASHQHWALKDVPPALAPEIPNS